MIQVLTQVIVGVPGLAKVLSAKVSEEESWLTHTCVACNQLIPPHNEYVVYTGNPLEREECFVCAACAPKVDAALIEAGLKSNLCVKQGNNPPTLTDCMGEGERLHALSQIGPEARHLGER